MSTRFVRNAALRPSQLYAVADRRFGDAQALAATDDNARADGTQDLAGLVIDISLKAQLLSRHPTVGYRVMKNWTSVRDSSGAWFEGRTPCPRC